jgi:hypothetical protein
MLPCDEAEAAAQQTVRAENIKMGMPAATRDSSKGFCIIFSVSCFRVFPVRALFPISAIRSVVACLACLPGHATLLLLLSRRLCAGMCGPVRDREITPAVPLLPAHPCAQDADWPAAKHGIHQNRSPLSLPGCLSPAAQPVPLGQFLSIRPLRLPPPVHSPASV